LSNGLTRPRWAFDSNCDPWCLKDVSQFDQSRNKGRFRWTVRLVVLSALIITGNLALFYATDHKALAMRLMREVNPLSSILPWATQNMRLNAFNVRVYDFLMLAMMVVQGFVLGSTIDLIRWFRGRRVAK
jgi:hypothetical protein